MAAHGVLRTLLILGHLGVQLLDAMLALFGLGLDVKVLRIAAESQLHEYGQDDWPLLAKTEVWRTDD